MQLALIISTLTLALLQQLLTAELCVINMIRAHNSIIAQPVANATLSLFRSALRVAFIRNADSACSHSSLRHRSRSLSKQRLTLLINKNTQFYTRATIHLDVPMPFAILSRTTPKTTTTNEPPAKVAFNSNWHSNIIAIFTITNQIARLQKAYPSTTGEQTLLSFAQVNFSVLSNMNTSFKGQVRCNDTATIMTATRIKPTQNPIVFKDEHAQQTIHCQHTILVGPIAYSNCNITMLPTAPSLALVFFEAPPPSSESSISSPQRSNTHRQQNECS